MLKGVRIVMDRNYRTLVNSAHMSLPTFIEIETWCGLLFVTQFSHKLFNSLLNSCWNCIQQKTEERSPPIVLAHHLLHKWWSSIQDPIFTLPQSSTQATEYLFRAFCHLSTREPLLRRINSNVRTKDSRTVSFRYSSSEPAFKSKR